MLGLQESDVLTVVKALIITSDRSQPTPLHHGQVYGITGQDAAGAHLMTHLGDVRLCNGLKDD